MSEGKYYVIEGQDATGKTTQAGMLAEWLRAKGLDVVVFGETGEGLQTTESVREIVLDSSLKFDPLSYVLFFTINRREFWFNMIQPVLNDGGIAIATRSWWSTIAYQGYGLGVDMRLIEDISRSCLPERYFNPDMALILTLSDVEREKRLKKQGGARAEETFKSKGPDFQRIVNRAYLEIASRYGVCTLEASLTPAEVFKQVLVLLGIRASD